MKKNLSFALLFAFAVTTLAFAQKDKSQRPSPPASASCDLGGGKTVATDYSSPRMKGRKIYGGLVPFGAVAVELCDVRDGEVETGGGELLMDALHGGEGATHGVEGAAGGVQPGPAGGEEFVERDGDAHGRSHECQRIGPSVGGG